MFQASRNVSPGANVPVSALAVLSLYNALMVEIERRRNAIGLPMERVSELAGTADRSYAKMLNPETVSGRRANWETLQLVIDVLYCNGFELRLVPSRERKEVAPGTVRKIMQEAVEFDRQTLRDRLSEIGMRGGLARISKMTPEQRSRSAKKAAKARWKRARAQQREMVDAAPGSQP